MSLPPIWGRMTRPDRLIDSPMIDVFVSYASQDRERVRKVVGAIEAMGCSVWWDREIGAGSAFDREIEKAIDDAHCIVVVWSANSVESEWVRTEANEGLEKGNLVPVAIESVKPPLAFRRIQTIDFASPDANASLVSAIAKLLPATASGDGLPCVGRAHELEIIRQHIDRAKQREGALLLFSGEAGVGKTRLASEASAIAQANGFLVLRGHCPDLDTAPPYQPLLEQIEQGTRTLSAEQMRTSLGENATELSKLMPELRQRYTDIPPYPVLPPEQERRYLLHGIGEFVARAAANRPLLLIFEDLHWADESTCILLRHLAERLKAEPVLLIGTYRGADLPASAPFGRVLQELIRERLAEDLPLQRLTRAQIVELLVRRFAAQPPDALVDLIHSETEGNPFFIEEVIRHLHEVGKLLTDAGKFRDGIEIADTEVPRGVRLIIEDRVGRVSAACKEVLVMAAVAGRTFSFDLLVKADTKHTEDDILDAVEEAEHKRLLEDVSADRVARYRFVHEQIRQTLLAGLSLPRRQRLHLRVADALEALYQSNAAKYASEIAHHLYQAGSAADHARTAAQLSLAGEWAIEALAFEDALRQFDLALGVLADGADAAARARLHSLRSEALHGAGRIPESLEALSAAVALAPTAALRDDYLLQRCQMLLEIWRGSEAIDDLEQLLTRARNGDDANRQLAVQHSIARAYYVMSLDRAGFAEKSRDAYEGTIELARAQGDTKTMGAALVATATLVDYWPEYATQAAANLDKAAQIARDTGDEEIAIDVATARLNVSMSDDGGVEGERVLTRLLERRDLVRLNAHYFRMMWATLHSGRLERCVEICDAGVALAYRIGTLPVQYPTIKAMALMELGRFSDAWDSLEQEIADDEHRFGAALRDLGRLQYEINVAAYEAALQRAPRVIDEAKHLSRAWMLRWISGAVAGMAASCADEPAMLERIESLVTESGASPGVVGTAAIALAHNDLAMARSQTGDSGGNSIRSSASVTERLRRAEFAAEMDTREERWAQARDHISAAIEVAREKNMRGYLWRLLGRQAQIEDALGAVDAAAVSRTEARTLQREIAATIPDAQHRTSFLQGRVARQLALAD